MLCAVRRFARTSPTAAVGRLRAVSPVGHRYGQERCAKRAGDGVFVARHFRHGCCIVSFSRTFVILPLNACIQGKGRKQEEHLC